MVDLSCIVGFDVDPSSRYIFLVTFLFYSCCCFVYLTGVEISDVMIDRYHIAIRA